jgi:thiamine-phosphate pyrophosphorylase
MADRCTLYYITDRTAFPGDELSRRRRLLEKLAEAARTGVDYIQLREKDLLARDLEQLGREAVNVLKQVRTENKKLETSLLINSRVDVALAVQADGVHLRSNDLSANEVRAIWEKGGPAVLKSASGTAVVGVSCHSIREVAQAASRGATFAVFGPVFEKKDSPATIPAGWDALQNAAKENIPVFALGGITLENARSCLEAGASGIAGIRLFQENSIASVVRRLRKIA